MYRQKTENRPHIDGLKQHVSANQGRGHRVEHIASSDYQAPIEAVCSHAGGKEQRKHGKKLEQPDEAEIKHAAGNLVDMPANGDGQHLDGENIACAGGDEQDEIMVRQQAPCRCGKSAFTFAGPVRYDFNPFIPTLPNQL